MQVLSEVVLSERGSFRRVRQYVPGHHPHLGVLIAGWTGAETVIERDVILPVRHVVVQHDRDLGHSDEPE